MSKKLLTVPGVAKQTGLTIGTTYQYIHRGLLPAPTKRIGRVGLFCPRTVRAFMIVNAVSARPNSRKSVKLRRRRSRGRKLARVKRAA